MCDFIAWAPAGSKVAGSDAPDAREKIKGVVHTS